MTRKKDKINWHEIVQEILDEHLPLMSGKEVQDLARERQHHILVDYYCGVKGPLKAKNKREIIRPFDHLKTRNIIEYKSLHEVLNEALFRHYVGRALVMERITPKKNYQGETTLTLILTHKPKGLLKEKTYQFKETNRWKYESDWIKDLKIYILVLREMNEENGGEALALLQVLEGEKKLQEKRWRSLFQQNLENIFVLKALIEKIDKEVAMNLAEYYKIEGRKEGKLEGKIEDTLKLLKLKLKKEVPATWKKAIEKINKENILDQLFEQIALSENPEELKRIIQKLI